jgi:hypothetical protein
MPASATEHRGIGLLRQRSKPRSLVMAFLVRLRIFHDQPAYVERPAVQGCFSVDFTT